MAPEQLINCRYAKPPCDIYGVGACLYWYLSGHGPHDLESGASAVARILNVPPLPLAERAPDLQLELARAVDRALAREPGERYSSAEHMRKALQQFI
jgi:eukaryotic-like serine/threonine-protein kinase